MADAGGCGLVVLAGVLGVAARIFLGVRIECWGDVLIVSVGRGLWGAGRSDRSLLAMWGARWLGQTRS